MQISKLTVTNLEFREDRAGDANLGIAGDTDLGVTGIQTVLKIVRLDKIT